MKFAAKVISGLLCTFASQFATAKTSTDLAPTPEVRTANEYFRKPVERIYAAPANTHNFGSWSHSIHYCPAGSYVSAFSLAIEPHQGGGAGEDDTGLNRISFRCTTPSGAETAVITSDFERWGQPREWHVCPAGDFIFWYQLKHEAYRGDGFDDTMGAGLRVGCRPFKSDNPIPSVQLEDPGIFGRDWSNEARCSGRGLIVGLRTKIEWHQGRDDDTALNDVEMYCFEPD